MQDKFALALYVDPGILQLCDPFSLQPFIALQIPVTTYSFLDYFMFHRNLLVTYNERQLLVVELDNEAKQPEESIFGMRADLHDELKIQAMQDYHLKYPKKSMFNRVHTIQESVSKFEKDNLGKPSSRLLEYQQFKRSASKSPKPFERKMDKASPAARASSTEQTKQLMHKNIV